MWGASFADFAKKAQELQEQASNLTAGEIFNLDAIQSAPETAKHQKDATLPPLKTVVAQQPQQPPAAQPSFSLPSDRQATTAAASPAVKKPQVQKGKLKMNMSPGQATKKGKLGSNTALVTKLSTSPENMSNDAVTKKEKKEDKNESLVENMSGPGQLPISVESGSTSTIPQGGPETEKSPFKDSEKSVIVEAKPAESDVIEKLKEVPAKTVPPMPDDHEGLSIVDDDKDAAASAEETNKNRQSHDAVTSAGDIDKAEDRKTTKEKGEERPLTNSMAMAALATEPDPSIKDENGKDASGAQSVGLFVAEKSGANIIDHVPEPIPSAEKVETKPVEAPVSVGPPQEKPEPTGEKDYKPGKDTKVPDATQIAGVFSTNQTPPVVQSVDGTPEQPKISANPQVPTAETGVESQRAMEQFTSQLKRIEENFEAERKEMNQQHQINIQQTIASKDQEKEQLLAKLREKDLKLRELKRTKEGNELRMDSLKREVEGIKKLLEERDAEIEDAKKMRGQDRKELENQVRAVESRHAKVQKELNSLKDELKNSKGELGTTHEEYTTLKSRVKVVASELKDRRAECRDLKSKIEDLEQSNEKLEDHVATLESQLSDRDRSGNEKEEEVGGLRSTIDELEQKLKDASSNAKAKEEEFEKSLGSYKKKAQNSLAIANSRAAAAVQAKEEAELEARAARSTADSTMERARVAEANGQKAMTDAKAYYQEMELAKEKAVNALREVEIELEQKNKSVTELQEKLELAASEKGNLAAEKAQAARDAETERTKCANLQRELTGAKSRLGVLENDVSRLQSQVQIAEAAATDAKKTQKPNRASSAPAEDSTTKATVMMLQHQLKEANESITELTEALQNAIALSEKSETTNMEAANGSGSNAASAATNGSESVPLFYAMEKQAELNTARNEINRLSSMYADVQSEKAEAQEALDATRKALDEERSKLQRYEKLGLGPSFSTEESLQDVNGTVSENAASGGRTNIEYLKNIMLSFLDAKTVMEKKALVPVIGAVLCLTPAEQTRAIQNVESTGGLEGFGSAFFETIGSKVGRS